MNTAVSGDEYMTDKQFDSIIEMVMQILNRSKDIEDAKNKLRAIKGEKAMTGTAKKNRLAPCRQQTKKYPPRIYVHQ